MIGDVVAFVNLRICLPQDLRYRRGGYGTVPVLTGWQSEDGTPVVSYLLCLRDWQAGEEKGSSRWLDSAGAAGAEGAAVTPGRRDDADGPSGRDAVVPQ